MRTRGDPLSCAGKAQDVTARSYDAVPGLNCRLAASIPQQIELYGPQTTLRTANRTATLSLATPPPRKRDNAPTPCRSAVTAAGDVLAGECGCVELAPAASNVSLKRPRTLIFPF